MRILTDTVAPRTGARALGEAVPFISQLRPGGAPSSFDGEAMCGPTSMAMIARHLGRHPHLSDVELVRLLARIGKTTDERGTTIEGMRAIARYLGLSCEVEKGSGVARARRELATGAYVIANGDYHAMPPHEDPTQYEGHYVLLHGLDRAGRFEVHDPYDPAVESVNALELGRFLAAHEEGGYVLIVHPAPVVLLDSTSRPEDWVRGIGTVARRPG